MATTKIIYIFWPRRIITAVCDEIPTVVEWKVFCKVKKVNYYGWISYFSINVREE
jgi:hypothetical protein